MFDFLTACGGLERRLRACLGGSLAAVAVMTSWPGAARAGPCRVVVADEEVRCPYHPIDSTRHNVVFVDLADDAIRAADIGQPDSPGADLAFDPFLADLGWTALATAVAPDLRRALVMRVKPSCPPYTGSPGPGIACSYGRVTLWLAYHDRSTGEWVHLNLARRGLGRNSEAHGWSTWLHRDLALFNAIGFPDDGGFYTRQEENVTQIYAVRFHTDRDFAIEPFAPDLLWRADCLTGRVNAQPPREQDRCFDGQRVSFVRRCYSEPPGPDTWAWWNTAAADGTGGPCIPGQPAMQVPVLRTYVMELDASCRPKHPFASMSPAHVPASGPVYRQMGVGPEWGDMLSAISADGRYLAMATNMGDPQRPGDNCAGMKMNLRDATNPLSGEANRNTHVCELDSSLRCIKEPVRLGTMLTPPEGTPLPGFVHLSSLGGFTRHVVFSRRWSQAGQPQINDVLRVDVDVGPNAGVPLQFGHNAVAILPVNYVPPASGAGGCATSAAPGEAWWGILVLLSRTRRRRSGVYMLLLLLAMSGGCARGAGSASTSTDAGPPIRTTDETQYLSFGLPVNWLFELTGPGGGDPEQIHLLIDSSVRDLTAKIGVAGDGRSRQLGFMLVLAPCPSLDDYTHIDRIDPAMGRLMDQDGAPKVRLGYCALTNAGYLVANPPPDLSRAIAEVNRAFVASWAGGLAGAGLTAGPSLHARGRERRVRGSPRRSHRGRLGTAPVRAAMGRQLLVDGVEAVPEPFPWIGREAPGAGLHQRAALGCLQRALPAARVRILATAFRFRRYRRRAQHRRDERWLDRRADPGGLWP